MLRMSTVAICLGCLLIFSAGISSAQTSTWYIGGNMGLSIGSGGGASSAGFHFGPMAEVVLAKQHGISSEFSINTQAGTPIEWANMYKYYITISGSKVKPYVDGGFGLWFITGGPYFGLRFGGGASFEVSKGMYVGPDMQFGPIFATGTTVFGILIRGTFRYQLPG